jgi:FdhD protein
MHPKDRHHPIKIIDLIFFDGARPLTVTEHIIEEIPVDIFVNGQKIITIACAGVHLDELAVGFLRAEGTIEVLDDVADVSVSPGNDAVYINVTKEMHTSQEKSIFSSGAKIAAQAIQGRTIVSDATIGASDALRLMEEHLAATIIHRETHGTHCSSLADGGQGIMISREDIGRHNTVDMLGGYTLLKHIDCSRNIFLTTGRISSEIVTKIWRLGIPIIMSHAVPTSRAIAMATGAGITIIGYMRRGTMRVYTHKERVLFL